MRAWTFRFHSLVAGLTLSDEKIESITLTNGFSNHTVGAKVFIDASGDGILLSKSDATYKKPQSHTILQLYDAAGRIQ
jgi:hypothetical protein